MNENSLDIQATRVW